MREGAPSTQRNYCTKPKRYQGFVIRARPPVSDNKKRSGHSQSRAAALHLGGGGRLSLAAWGRVFGLLVGRFSSLQSQVGIRNDGSEVAHLIVKATHSDSFVGRK